MNRWDKMKRINKLVGMLLVAALCLNQGIVIRADKEEQVSTGAMLYYQEDFESYNDGDTKLTDYGGSEKSNEWYVKEEKNNKYFEMHVNSESDMHLDKALTGNITGKFVFEMSVMFRDYGNVNKYIELIETPARDAFMVVFTPAGQITTYDGKILANYALNKFYKLDVIVDTDNDTMSVYINGKNRVKNYPYSIENVASFRIHLTNVLGESTMCIDNLKIYSGDIITDVFDTSIASDSTTIDVKEIMADSTAMYVGKSNVLLHGEKAYMSDDRSIKPYIADDTYMIPVRYFANSIGAEINWNNENKTTDIFCNNKSITLCLDSTSYLDNGSEKALSHNAEIGSGGVLYAPAKALCEAFGKQLHTEENGVIIYSDSDKESVFDWQNNTKIMRKICESYMFDDVSGSEILETIKTKFPSNLHPRLVFTNEKFNAIKKEIQDPDGDAVYKKLFEIIKRNADAYLNEKTSGYELRDGTRLLYVCRENHNRMLACAIMYNLTGDERYAERAYLEMYTSACFIDWNPYHFLDVGEMSACMGFAYDWLYNWMDESKRKVIREAIVSKGIYPIIDDFDNKPRSRSWNWRGELADNWCFVITGVGVGALSVIDELSDQDLINAQRATEQTLIDIRRALSLFSPLGAYEEGYSYWAYAMKYFAFYMQALQTSVGSDFGYVDIPGMRLTNRYIKAVNGSVNVFSYHDSGMSGVRFDPQMMFVADYFNNYAEAIPVVNNILKGRASADDAICSMMLYTPEFLQYNNQNSELDIYLPISEIATMRSGWNENDMFVGFHCDNPMGDGKGHSHMDVGQFVLDANGESYFVDLGAEDYNLPGYSDAYRLRAEGHNVVVINPDEGYGQKYGGSAKIVKTEFKEKGGFAIGDLTDAYDEEDGMESYKRGIKLDCFRKKTTVQDEIRLSKPGDIWWFAHTPAEITISDDKKTAILDIGGSKLIGKIENGDGAEFTVLEAKPFPTSPNPANQNQNEGYRKLAIHAPNCSKLDLCVTFTSYDFTYDEKIFKTEFVPLDEWKIEDGPFEERKFAEADTITINGIPLKGFSPDVYNYTVSLSEFNGTDAFVEAQSSVNKIVVEQKNGICGEAKVYVENDDPLCSNSVYSIFFNIDPTLEQPKGKTKVKPVSVKASAVPEATNTPENTIDGSLNSRWSCPGICWIEYDLGRIYDLDSVGVAFMNGTSRTAQFSIDVSVDGTNWKTYFSGDSLSTLELDNHKLFGEKARYVRINGKGYDNKPKEYTSITEFACYVNN